MTERQVSNGERNDRITGGLILIAIGVVALALQIGDYFDVGMFILPAVGIILLVWGVLVRHVGPMIPGGILTGIGAGVLLQEYVAGPAEGDDGGLFLLGFAAGWVLITLLSARFTAETHWWPLIVGGILGFIGLAVTLGGVALTLLEFAGRTWPLVLIGLGLYFIYRHFRQAA